MIGKGTPPLGLQQPSTRKITPPLCYNMQVDSREREDGFSASLGTAQHQDAREDDSSPLLQHATVHSRDNSSASLGTAQHQKDDSSPLLQHATVHSRDDSSASLGTAQHQDAREDDLLQQQSLLHLEQPSTRMLGKMTPPSAWTTCSSPGTGHDGKGSCST